MLYPYTGSDMSLLIDFTKRLWDPFIEPIRQGRLQITEFVKCLKEVYIYLLMKMWLVLQESLNLKLYNGKNK